jgi:hypothetical protein
MITRECALRLRCNGQGVPARADILRRYCSPISAAQRVEPIIRLRVEGANRPVPALRQRQGRINGRRSGLGKRPNWLKAQLAAGRRLDEFRITD